MKVEMLYWQPEQARLQLYFRHKKSSGKHRSSNQRFEKWFLTSVPYSGKTT